ncbi:arylsulfatase [Parapedobacter pyrenivorans]|uniref:Arylsulfatase n=1 Tax=Parapedobacter pyrenivorans TaxID=1305674 RepID=A0A917M9V4_9SPHI|nr:arylsulfatase [Parapedobacter pyrenivorans]GGG84176.1 arylsulfatase [Parapedobacter pyrenivorans]
MNVRLFFMMAGLVVLSQAVRAQDKRPNIVLIMADDMGYSDIGCYGGEIETPNLDRLATEGLRFSQFYNNARCCPSRASLMTGLYPHQTGIGHMTNDPEDSTAFNYGLPAYSGDLNFQSVTIAEVLKSAGYQTLMTGKWHLGYHDRSRWPLQRGFDKYYGLIAGASNFFEPSGKRGLTLMNDPIEPEGNDFYVTDAFTDYAIQFVNESQAESDAPFFLYLAYTSPHWPLNALTEDIAKYRGTYKAGWKTLRRERFERMQRMGVIDGQVTQLSDDDGAEWDKLTPEQQDEMDYRMAIYAAQVDRMDQNIGRLIETLEASGELENTLIFFLTDNGACAEGGLLGGGEKELLGGKGGYFLTYGQSWANASATPYRTYKHWVHEGGIGTPLIVHWPQGIVKRVQGDFTDQYGFLQDIMATAIDVADADYPTKYNGESITPLQGQSMRHVLQGEDTPIHEEPIFWEHEGNGAVRYGNLKLVKAYQPGNPSNWELYDISKDRSEMNDLSAEMPDAVAELSGYYDQWAVENGVLPYDEVLQIRKEKNAKR